MAFARNNTAKAFNNISAVPTHFALWNAATAGTLKASSTVTLSPAPSVGDNINFAIDAIVIQIPNGAFTDSGSDDAVDGFVSSTLYGSLHTASPPTTSNQITVDDADRKSITMAEWDVEAT